MREHMLDRQRRGVAALARGAGLVVAIAIGGCSGAASPPAEADGTGGTEAASGGASGKGKGGSTGRGGAGGAVGSGGAGPVGGSPSGGSPGAGGAPTPDAAPPPDTSGGEPPADAAAGEASTGACGMLAQACCAGDTCMAGAPTPNTGTPGGMTVLELKANGGDPYKQVAEKNLLPIDGPDSGYIFDDGTSFLFVLHENGAEETVSSGARRQRNEVTVNPGNPAIYKGMKGDTMSYTWRFRLEKMNANPTWCDIFQIKQHGPLGVAPYMAFEANKSNLEIDTEKMGVIRSIPLSAIMNVWINASVTIKYADQGSLAFTLKKDDGTTILSYSNDNADMWDTTVDFVRPKWGLYRNKRDGAGEAAIRYNNMKIIRGTVGTAAGCTCR
jgi:hypothetical protein